MSDKELRELDAWIAGHVMGWKKVLFINRLNEPENGQTVTTFYKSPTEGVLIPVAGQRSRVSDFKPITDRAAAMMVLEKCLKEQRGTHIAISDRSSIITICGVGQERNLVETTTLPLAIALFAKKLFSK